jgi:hypothetical protein
MKKETPVTGKPSAFLIWSLIISAIILFALAILLYTFEKPPQEQTFATIFSCFLAGLGLYSLLITRNNHSLTILSDRLIVKSIGGYVVHEMSLDEIISWTEIRKTRGKSLRAFLHLTIHTANIKYQISSESYRNYSEIKNKLTAGKPRKTEEERKWHKKDNLKHSGICLFSACVLLYYAFFDEKGFLLQLVLCLFSAPFAGVAIYLYLKAKKA